MSSEKKDRLKKGRAGSQAIELPRSSGDEFRLWLIARARPERWRALRR